MNGRFFRFVVIIVLALLAASVARPYVTRLLPGDTAPRPIASRGDLTDAERSIIAVFERVSPSVVQVVGRQNGRDVSDEESVGTQSGTGFVWDAPARAFVVLTPAPAHWAMSSCQQTTSLYGASLI